MESVVLRDKSNYRKFKARATRVTFFCGWQRHRCYLCRREMFDPRSAHAKCTGEGWTEDHVRPRSSHNGVIQNSAMAHHRCNQRKKNRPAFACEKFFAREMWIAYEAFRVGLGEVPFPKPMHFD